MALKLFVDFDGTIATNDVGDAFFLNFGGPACAQHVEDYRAEKISARECFIREAAAIGRLNIGDAERFLAGQSTDQGFGDFVAFCSARAVPFHILSDGLDFYIHRILANNGLSGLSVFCNRLECSEVGTDGTVAITLTFPYPDAECSRCACCKRNIMLTLAGDDDIIGYVGEGYSDRCPARYADVVFAKGELQVFCQKENIPYFLYSSFHDVVNRLDDLLSRGVLRKRRRAELARRDLFMREP